MTKLNLNETSLLEVSGELDPAARERLEHYFLTHPHARTVFDRLKSDMDLLRSLPRVELTARQKEHYAAQIKGGIHQHLRETRRQEAAARRRKFIYSALAGISAAAAAVVVVAGLMMLDHSANEKRQQAKIDAINNVIDYGLAYQETSNPYDDSLRDVANSIHELQNQGPSVAGIQDSEMSNLLDALSTLPGDSDIAPPPGPGSL